MADEVVWMDAWLTTHVMSAPGAERRDSYAQPPEDAEDSPQARSEANPRGAPPEATPFAPAPADSAPRNHGASPTRFVDALAELGIADAELLVTFAVQLGGDPDMETMDFDDVEAKSVAETIRNLKPPDPIDGLGLANPSMSYNPVAKGKLFRACQTLAAHRNGSTARSYLKATLHGETEGRARDAAPPPPAPPAPETRERSAFYARLTSVLAAAVKPEPKKKSREEVKFDGVLQQGGAGANETFQCLTRREYTTILRNFEKRHGEIPKEEKPSLKQLSAVIAKLDKDENCAPDFCVMGPFGDRAYDIVTMTADVLVDGERRRMKVRGPSSITEWKAHWRVFRMCMLILNAVPEGPLDAYERRIVRLATKYPSHWALISFADEICRREGWSDIRQEIENDILDGAHPKAGIPISPGRQ